MFKGCSDVRFERRGVKEEINIWGGGGEGGDD